MAAIRVLLADDHAIVRQGLRSLLEEEQDLLVVGEAKDGREAIQLADKTRPDVIVMDISMSELGGLEATRQIVRQFPAIQVVILSIHTEGNYVYAALRAGAKGYVLKTCAYDELREAIKSAMRGDVYLSSTISPLIIEGYSGEITLRETAATYESLTPRQREILQLIAEGRSRQEIADILGISPKTVSRHREDIMHALGVTDDAALVKFAIRAGIIDQ